MQKALTLLLLILLGFSPVSLVGQSEAEAETEAESEAEVEAEAGRNRGLAASAQSAAAAATGNFAITAALTSASVVGLGGAPSGVCNNTVTSNTFGNENNPVADTLSFTPQDGEVEAEVEVEIESEAEAEAMDGGSSGGAGTSISIGVARTDVARPSLEGISVSQDASSSTAADRSQIKVGTVAAARTVDYQHALEMPAALRRAAESTVAGSSGGGKLTLTRKALAEQEVEAEVEAGAEAEAEAEASPGHAAAAASGGGGVGATGTTAASDAIANSSSSALTADVTEAEPEEFTTNAGLQSMMDGMEVSVDSLAMVIVDMMQNPNGFPNGTGGGDPDTPGEAEAESEVEGEVEAEAETSNRSAAASAVVSGAAGSAGRDAYGVVASASNTSVSVNRKTAKENRNNDQRANTINEYIDPDGRGTGRPEAEAEAETESEATASSRTNFAAAETNTSANGSSTSESQTRLTTLTVGNLKTRGEGGFERVRNIGTTQSSEMNTSEVEVEVESEAEAEAEAEVGYHSAAAAAGALAGLARNQLENASGAHASTSTSTSVDGQKENLHAENNRTIPTNFEPSAGMDEAEAETETEAEAEAEVGLFAGAGAGSAAAAGYKGIRAQVNIKLTEYAAAVCYRSRPGRIHQYRSARGQAGRPGPCRCHRPG